MLVCSNHSFLGLSLRKNAVMIKHKEPDRADGELKFLALWFGMEDSA